LRLGLSRSTHPVHWFVAARLLPERYVRDSDAARDLFVALADAPCEIAAFAYLDPEWRLLGMRHSAPGEMDSAEVPLRLVARDAIAFDAVAVIMAHNHPSGDTTPSKGDFSATRRISRALDTIGVRLIDHLVLAGNQYTSLREAGHL
jgi:DNA repair protein RadC